MLEGLYLCLSMCGPILDSKTVSSLMWTKLWHSSIEEGSKMEKEGERNGEGEENEEKGGRRGRQCGDRSHYLLTRFGITSGTHPSVRVCNGF